MKRLNREHGIRFILLIAWAIYLFWLLSSGSITAFIHPKRLYMMWGAQIVILIFALFEATKVFKESHEKRNMKRYIPIFLVLVCCIVISLNLFEEKDIYRQGQTPVHKGLKQSKESDQLPSSKVIELNESNYAEILSLIEANPEEYKGRKIRVEGFVYKQEDFPDKHFVLGRMYMTCCAADAQIVGFMCQWEETPNLEKDEWVRVEGILQTTHYKENGEDWLLPIIYSSKVTKIPKPDNQYIY